MGRTHETRVADHPSRPLLAFDGQCGFCRQWVEWWRGITGDRVEYRPNQEVADRFPEIGAERFAKRVWLIEPDGRATSGARAVFRLYAQSGERRWLAWLAESFPAFGAAAESVYDLVARHREAAAIVTRGLWGRVPQRPRYRRMRSVFLRALGVAYLAAFWSLGVQVDGLIGSRGILPAAEYLEAAKRSFGSQAYWRLPTLLWLDASDRALHLLCWGGAALGAMLVAGVCPGACLVLLWLFYLSLTVAGQVFLGYQWDGLLLESGLLAILFTPWGPWLGRARRAPSRGAVWLIRWLVFRLMFLSAVVKLTSGDPTWRAWEAMRYHYETQPLPAWTSWFMHQLPPWSHKLSVGYMFWAELIAPFLVFAPRRPRMLGLASLVLLQVLIAATGNFGFFNLLALVLCVSLLEDRDLGRKDAGNEDVQPEGIAHKALVAVVGTVLVLVTSMQVVEAIWPAAPFPGALEVLRQEVEPLRSANPYGLFAVMTTDRPEILLEGSADGVTWTPYRFRWKPCEPERRPRFTTPHLPRLDWQMWFAALARDCRSQPWFLAFELRLLEGSPEVSRLLRVDPFRGQPPRYVRARLFLYRFTTWGAKAWWTREEVGTYCPAVGLSRGVEEDRTPP